MFSATRDAILDGIGELPAPIQLAAMCDAMAFVLARDGVDTESERFETFLDTLLPMLAGRVRLHQAERFAAAH